VDHKTQYTMGPGVKRVGREVGHWSPASGVAKKIAWIYTFASHMPSYEGWNFNSGNYLFTTDTK